MQIDYFLPSFSMPGAIGRVLLPAIGRGQIDRNPFSVWPAQPAVANGGGDSVLALFDRSVWQPDHRDLIGVTPSGVHFDLHFKRFDPDDGRRINLRWHNRTYDVLLLQRLQEMFFWTIPTSDSI
jgi:hypothetical protein